ncbi:MMPL family transporter [Yinghuangia seranimata]|uniref:MMPL family transporter n=1 Tax=Yinghuangia seranimata TaxID=408067 RepID=UPI00248B19E8|nr:MMPL family transporter [Yinghuangia seranimata]MDI2131992.1 MMPL family transporter [Yinghuangia seranimata]
MDAVERPKRSRRWVWGALAVWVLAVLALGPLAGKLEGVTDNDAVAYLPQSAQSTKVADVLGDMPGGDTTDVVVVYHRDGGLTDADRAAADAQARAVVAKFATVGGQVPQGMPSVDGATLAYPFQLTEKNGLPNEVVPDVRDLLDDHPAGLSVLVGGPGATAADMDEVFGSIDGTLMLVTLLVVAVLLIATYRSPFLWLVPLVCVGIAAAATQGLVYVLVKTTGITVTGQSSGITTVLVFGAGTDYALLLIARYREELRRAARPMDAMSSALRGVLPALLASAGTVVAGLACLLAADLNNMRGLGPVAGTGVVCALAVMTTLLPALLVLLGRRVFWPLIPAYGSAPRARTSVYARIGGFVARRPAAVLAAGAVLLGALAFGTVNMPGELRLADGFTKTPDSVTAGEQLGKAFPERGSQPIQVVARTEHAAEAVAAAKATEGVVDARTGRAANGWTEITITAKDKPESAGEHATVHRLRDRLADVAGARAAVGGATAQRMDQDTATSRDEKVVVPLVLAAVLLILVLLLRSLAGPLLLVAVMGAVWFASLGVGALFFEPVFGFAGVDPSLPLLSFVFLVALGVDYGIFLMHRMREEALAGAPAERAVVVALTKTGGVIASAGFVLAATFSVLTVLPLVMLVELGFVVAVGVLIDTFLVRTFLVTGASVLLGRRIWWPGRLASGPDARAPEREPEPSSMMAG